MVVWGKLTVLVLFIAVFAVSVDSYEAPEVIFQAVKSGGFRVYVPAVPGTKSFKFHANIGQEVSNKSATQIFGESGNPQDGYFGLQFDNKLEAGNVLYYGIFVTHDRLGYRKDEQKWEIKASDVLDSYPSLSGTPSTCTPSSTVKNGGTSTCVGDIILRDDFQDSPFKTQSWVVEHRIPSSGIFNSYEAREDIQFVKTGILYFKPIALQQDTDVRGSLDLRNGCTSKVPHECLAQQQYSLLLPPVKSGRITSKTSFKYGKVNIRAKLPAGEWIIPVIELQPKDKVDGQDPPKILIAYYRGNDHLTSSAGDDIGSRQLYGGPSVPSDIDVRSMNLKPRRSDSPYSSEFHDYSVKWSAGKLEFFFDNKPYGEVSVDAPFNKEYVLSLGVAVGGHLDFPDGYRSGDHDKPWSNEERDVHKKFFDARSVWSSTWKGDNAALQVDYVTVTAI